MWVNLGLNVHIALAQYKTRDTSVAEPGEAIGNWPTDQKQTNKQTNKENKSKQKELTTTTLARKRKFGGVRIHTPENLTHTRKRALPLHVHH